MTLSVMHLVAIILLAGLFGALCARMVAQRLQRDLLAQLQAHEQALRTMLEAPQAVPLPTLDFDEARVAQCVQQVIQREIESLAQRQLASSEALAREQQRWNVQQDARRAEEMLALEEMRALLEALQARSPPGTAARVAIPRPPAPPPPPPSATPAPAPTLPPPAVSARPPELLQTPLPRPLVVPSHEPERELSDEEIDALPPELPAPVKPRKRMLSAPSKPPLRSI